MVHCHFKIDFFPSLNCYFWGCKLLQLYLFISGIYLQRFYSALYFLTSPFILYYFCALWILKMQALSFYCLTFAKFFSSLSLFNLFCIFICNNTSLCSFLFLLNDSCKLFPASLNYTACQSFWFNLYKRERLDQMSSHASLQI